MISDPRCAKVHTQACRVQHISVQARAAGPSLLLCARQLLPGCMSPFCSTTPKCTAMRCALDSAERGSHVAGEIPVPDPAGRTQEAVRQLPSAASSQNRTGQLHLSSQPGRSGVSREQYLLLPAHTVRSQACCTGALGRTCNRRPPWRLGLELAKLLRAVQAPAADQLHSIKPGCCSTAFQHRCSASHTSAQLSAAQRSSTPMDSCSAHSSDMA